MQFLAVSLALCAAAQAAPTFNSIAGAAQGSGIYGNSGSASGSAQGSASNTGSASGSGSGSVTGGIPAFNGQANIMGVSAKAIGNLEDVVLDLGSLASSKHDGMLNIATRSVGHLENVVTDLGSLMINKKQGDHTFDLANQAIGSMKDAVLELNNVGGEIAGLVSLDGAKMMDAGLDMVENVMGDLESAMSCLIQIATTNAAGIEGPLMHVATNAIADMEKVAFNMAHLINVPGMEATAMSMINEVINDMESLMHNLAPAVTAEAGNVESILTGAIEDMQGLVSKMESLIGMGAEHNNTCGSSKSMIQTVMAELTNFLHQL